MPASAGKKEGRASTVHSANSSPSAPPATPRTRLSVSICRSTRPRLAPSARRTATSRLRALARDRRRPATLAHAISRTSPTAAIRVAPIIATSARNLGSSRVCGRTTIGRGSSGCASVPRLVVGDARREARRDRVQLTLGLLEAAPARQPAHDGEAAVPTLRGIVPRLERRPELECRAETQTVEPLRRHADDRHRSAVNGDLPAQRGRRTAESPMRQAVADHAYRWRPRLRVRRSDCASGSRLKAEEIEELPRHSRRADPLDAARRSAAPPILPRTRRASEEPARPISSRGSRDMRTCRRVRC